MLWGLCLALNLMVNEDRRVHTFHLFAQIVTVFKAFKEDPKLKFPRWIGELLIDKSRRGFYDGASKGYEKLCDIGCVLFFLDPHYITFEENLDKGTNNYAKIMSLRDLLQLDIGHHIQSMEVYGNST